MHVSPCKPGSVDKCSIIALLKGQALLEGRVTACVIMSYLLGVSENERETSNYCQCLRKKKGKVQENKF